MRGKERAMIDYRQILQEEIWTYEFAADDMSRLLDEMFYKKVAIPASISDFNSSSQIFFDRESPWFDSPSPAELQGIEEFSAEDNILEIKLYERRKPRQFFLIGDTDENRQIFEDFKKRLLESDNFEQFKKDFDKLQQKHAARLPTEDDDFERLFECYMLL